MILILLASIIPAILLVEIGRPWHPGQGGPERSPGWSGFLNAALGCLLGIALLAVTVFGDFGSLLLLMVLPSICALLAEGCLYLIGMLTALLSRRTRLSLGWRAGLVLVNPVLLAVFASLGDPWILRVILFGGALLASAWLVWNSPGGWITFSYLLLLLLMLTAVWATDTQSEFLFLPATLASIGRNLWWVVPGLGIIFSCMLVGQILTDELGSTAPRLFLAGLIVPILLLLAWQAATASAWDVATDGLGGIFMLQLSCVFGVAAAIHQSWKLPPKRSSLLFGFALLILVMVLGANSFGTFGFDGEWANVPHARTERRAEKINQAILRFYQERGQYPQALTDLTPVYLLYLPTPFIIPHQDWCYQAGSDYYRLGYVYRDYFSTPASVKVFAAAGQPPDPFWACDAEAAKYPSPLGP